VEGTTLSGEFEEMIYKKDDVLQSQSVFVCKTCMYVYTCIYIVLFVNG
jgi:hypothetical protein